MEIRRHAEFIVYNALYCKVLRKIISCLTGGEKIVPPAQ